MMNENHKPKLKIGILIRDFETLHNFEYEIIDRILADDDLQLVCLFKDGRAANNQPQNIFQRIFKTNFLGRAIFKLQVGLEQKMFPQKQHHNKAQVIQRLSQIPTFKLNPAKRGFVDLFSQDDADIILAQQLDVLLRQAFNIIKGPILSAAKHGIWSFHHADNAVNRGGPACFWEILQKEPCVGVTLQQLTPVLDGGNVIEKAFYNPHHSFVVTQNDVFNSSVSLLMKNLRKLGDGSVVFTPSPPYEKPLYKQPKLWPVLKYVFGFYKTVLLGNSKRFFANALGKRTFVWALFPRQGNFLETNLNNIEPLPMPSNEFWADPFLLKQENDIYAFFENYNYATKKGKISCVRMVDGQAVDLKDALDLPYHLSYPNIIKQGSEIFMIPETTANNRLEIFRCIEFPNKWELHATAFENEKVVDATFYEDEKGERWLFLNKGLKNFAELHIYKIDSLSLNSIQPHKTNPVKIDALSARNAGAIFKFNDEYYRPSQLNSHGKYGNGLNINKIIQLDLENYVEEKITTIQPAFKQGLVGIHHLHQIEDYFVFDACYNTL